MFKIALWKNRQARLTCSLPSPMLRHDTNLSNRVHSFTTIIVGKLLILADRGTTCKGPESWDEVGLLQSQKGDLWIWRK